MKREKISVLNEDGNIINIEVLCSFKVDVINKSFVVYYASDEVDYNEDGVLIVGEILTNDEEKKCILGVKKEDEKIVNLYLKEIFGEMEDIS